ncbi:HAMP domain-containing protein, partial [Stenotrophomonas maltophilia]|uniref:HAMP domain-containing protein n=1 Tax=Stenotrophomonas maltophilia TaxID=40324 RepID=UPI00195495CA
MRYLAQQLEPADYPTVADLAGVRPWLEALARIEAVRRAAGAVGRGALDTRLSVADRDELGLLVAEDHPGAGAA